MQFDIDQLLYIEQVMRSKKKHLKRAYMIEFINTIIQRAKEITDEKRGNESKGSLRVPKTR